MPDSSNQNPPDFPPETQVSLTSEQFAKFREALEVLYIEGNLSGRNQFFKAWPVAAEYVLGQDLLRYDHEGVADKEHRAALEKEAEARRIEFLEFMDTLQRKSVDKGVLQVEYVREAVEAMGRALALLVYSDNIVDRFIAPPQAPVIETAVEQEPAEEIEEEPVIPVIGDTPVRPVAPSVVPVAPTAVPDAEELQDEEVSEKPSPMKFISLKEIKHHNPDDEEPAGH